MAQAERDYASEPAQLAQIREFVDSFCREGASPALDDDGINRLELAVNETAGNIMRHAHHNCTDQQIHIEAVSSDEDVSILLRYCGAIFDPDVISPPSFDGSREGGFGLYIISQCVDEVRYAQDDAGSNTITLVKRRVIPDASIRRPAGA